MTRALFLFPLLLCAQKVPDQTLHRPTPVPDRVILTWSGDPATTQAVTWRTEVSSRPALAQIAVAGDGPDFVKQARQVDAATELLRSDLNEAQYHSVEFTGLEPGTLYAYRVGDGQNWSEWSQFRTAQAGPAPLEFLYVGDAQNNIHDLWSRVVRMAFTEAPKARFIVHAGDLINTATKDADWGEWHAAPGWINRSMPSVPTPGNHEYGKGADGGRTLTSHWRPQFTLPRNGPAGLEETCYYIDIQGVRLIALNSNEKQKEQAEWLDRLLASNPNRWTVATFHHPVYSTAKGRDNKELRELWQPLFDKYAIDLVMTGHDHTYGRTNLATGLPRQETGRAGTVYVVSVSGPKMYEHGQDAVFHRKGENTQLFQIIRIDGNKLMYEARTARGVLYDAFELRKGGPHSPNKLINRIPPTPERMNPPAPQKTK